MTPEVKERIEQIRHGVVPEGYATIGQWIIPKDWPIANLAQVSDKSGYGMNVSAKEYDGKNKYIRITDIDDMSHKYIHSNAMSPDGNLCDEYKVNSDDLLFARTGASTGKTYLYSCEDGTLYFAGFLIRFHIKKDCSSHYVFYHTQTAQYNKWINIMSVRSGQPGINAQEYGKYRFPLPSYLEQNRIAAVLVVQDEIIDLKEKLLAEKQRQKKYLMQQLLTGKKRLPGFDGEWKTVRLGQISKRIRERNHIGSTNVMTISAQFGLINQEEFFNKAIASDDKSNYFLLHRNDFAYNKSYSTGYPYGAIKRLTRYDSGIVSPLYICFRIKRMDVSADFMAHYFEAGLMNREIQAFAQEGARNHGLLNIAVEDFFNSKITLPPFEEQQAIAAILTTADKEIDLLRQDLEQEKQKKKALMQLLLTGIVRVNA